VIVIGYILNISIYIAADTLYTTFPLFVNTALIFFSFLRLKGYIHRNARIIIACHSKYQCPVLSQTTHHFIRSMEVSKIGMSQRIYLSECVVQCRCSLWPHVRQPLPEMGESIFTYTTFNQNGDRKRRWRESVGTYILRHRRRVCCRACSALCRGRSRVLLLLLLVARRVIINIF
jgi:hypothetical protein